MKQTHNEGGDNISQIYYRFYIQVNLVSSMEQPAPNIKYPPQKVLHPKKIFLPKPGHRDQLTFKKRERRKTSAILRLSGRS